MAKIEESVDFFIRHVLRICKRDVLFVSNIENITNGIAGDCSGGSYRASGHPGVPQLKYELDIDFSGHNGGLLS